MPAPEPPKSRKRPRVVSLFTGAGGLDLGLEAAGFVMKLCVELDADCRATLRKNRKRWRQADPSDINELTEDPDEILRQAKVDCQETDLVAGGPPCQPFSKSGYWAKGDSARLDDPRASTLTGYMRAIESLQPRALLLENVRGIAFSQKDEGIAHLHKQLDSINDHCGTNYTPMVFCLNAADFGIPQLRERVFVVASRDGLPFTPPTPTHAPADEVGDSLFLQPHRTAWDAIGDLDDDSWPEELEMRGKWSDLLPSIPEGQNYLWHTPRMGGKPLFGWRTRYWSFLLKLAKNAPSWTIQAQPGPATGPFHWRSRQLSMRELARLQTFPDDYEVAGDRRAVQRQLGNAVPSALGELLGLEIRRQLLGHRVDRALTLIPSRRLDMPPPERVRPVRQKFLQLRADHADHPGTGMGPSAIARRDGTTASTSTEGE